jgi:cysteine desulfurase / selenocysteine lyase
MNTSAALTSIASSGTLTGNNQDCSCGLHSRQQIDSAKKDQSQNVRQQFPIFKTHPEILFFDNAATTQKPRSVIDTITTFYRDSCTNAGRASYPWSTQLSRKIEESRLAVARLINADPSDVAFTSGATDSLNLVATSWGLNNLQDQDEIVLCLDDHKSATLPWFNVQKLLEHFGINIKIIPFTRNSNGAYDRASLKTCLSNRTRLIALSHIHHLYGIKMDLCEPNENIPSNVLISLDASQSIGHTELDIQSLGVHFVSFSGHKMFASNGTGVLWVDPKLRQHIWPSRAGAKSALTISPFGLELDDSTLAGIIECGTLNLPGIVSYQPAVEFIESVGLLNIEEHLSMLTHRLHKRLKAIPNVKFAPGIGTCTHANGFGIIAFKLVNTNSSDLAAYLASQNIFVRSGDHCLASPGSEEDYLRVSLHIYNTFEEIDFFAEALMDACS